MENEQMTYQIEHLTEFDCAYGVPQCLGTCSECDPYGLTYTALTPQEEAELLDTRGWLRSASETALMDEMTVQLTRAEAFLEENVDVTAARSSQVWVILILRELKRRLEA